MEKDPIINKFLPTDRCKIYFYKKKILIKKIFFLVNYSCAYINAGIIESILNESNFVLFYFNQLNF